MSSEQSKNQKQVERSQLTEAEIKTMFIQGDRNLKQGNYSKAVEIFEQLEQEIDINSSDYFNIQRGLVKAYQGNDQKELAIALCQQMALSQATATSIWGQKFLEQLAPEVAQVITNSLSSLSKEKLLDQPEKLPSIKLKTLAEFKSYCQEHLLEDLKEFERKRQQTWMTILASGFICFVVPILIFLVIRQSSNFYLLQLFQLNAWILVIVGFCWIFFCQGCIQVYGLGFKRKIIQKIVDFIDENQQLTYASQLLLENKRQTAIAFTQSQLFQSDQEEPDLLEQEDCVYGTIAGVNIFFAEICVQNYTENHDWVEISNLNKLQEKLNLDNFIVNFLIQGFIFLLQLFSLITFLLFKAIDNSDNNKLEQYFKLNQDKDKKNIFRGLFFTAQFPKHFPGHTIVIPNQIQTKFNPLNYWRGEIVKLEDPEFNQLFCVYSSDQIEARYILSTNLMNRLVEFSKKAKRKVYLSFVEGKIYIAIKYNHNLFEPKLWQSMLSFAPLKEYFENLQLMISIVEELKLNRYIWTK
jgi:hypothetical protein